ncbi:MAG: DUF3618 domain-containing protein [Candidatus Nanopelagicales bacterium]
MSDASDAVVPAAPTGVDKKPSPEVVKGQPQPAERSIAEIESDMEATRARLAVTLEELKVAAQPKTILNRQAEKVKSFYVDEYGAVRIDHVAITVGVVVGLIVVRRTWRRITA